MDSSFEDPTLQHDPAQMPTTLQVDYLWKKFRVNIFASDKPSQPLYILKHNILKNPDVVFESAIDKTVIGTCTLHCTSINASYECHGRKGTLKALKRWKTAYTYLSYAFSDDEKPVAMTWKGSCGLKGWEFTCLDEQQMPVARFEVSCWNMRHMGKIEFLGDKSNSSMARDEIVITALTLTYCMTLRSVSFASFLGAFFARPGPIENKAGTQAELPLAKIDRS